MTTNEATLLTWHSKNHGIQVLEDTLRLLRRKRKSIARVLYLSPHGEEFQPPAEVHGAHLEYLTLDIQDPSDHAEVYRAVSETVLPRVRSIPNLHINVSPGTPAMHCVWLILHAGGAFPKSTRLWSSQRPAPDRDTRLNPVDVPVSTYLAEIRHQARLQAPDAQYDPEARSEPRRRAFEDLYRFASIPHAPLLILGERGTGKTRLVESWIPRLKRREKIVVVPCGTLDSSLAESELFGHVKGAFTGAEKDRDGLLANADGGILFLDEVQDLPMGVQRKLIRFLQDRRRRYRRVGSDEEYSVDVEVVCASNLSLPDLAGRLAPDLFDRLSHFLVTIPPLRQCREDLEADWERVWQETCTEAGLPEKPPDSPSVLRALKADPLSGNLRDLQRLALHIAAWWHGNTPEQACHEALKSWRRSHIPHAADSDDSIWGTGSRNERIRNFKRLLARRFKQEHGSWAAAAKALDCDERTLRADAR